MGAAIFGVALAAGFLGAGFGVSFGGADVGAALGDEGLETVDLDLGAAFGIREDMLGRDGPALPPLVDLALDEGPSFALETALGLGLPLGLGFIPAGVMLATNLRNDSGAGRPKTSGTGIPSPAKIP